MRSFLFRCPITVVALSLGLLSTAQVQAAIVTVRVTVENLAPVNGVAITPVWVGFHSGNFDSYNSGAGAGRAVEGLERLAEDGTTSVISTDFQAGLTYVDGLGNNSVVAATGSTANRVDGTIVSSSGPPPLTPGQSASMDFLVENDGSNNFFSYATMVLPSNDFFLANGDPTARDLSSILDADGGTISFLIGTPGTVNDAGTEAEDFASSAANGLFPGRGLPAGQGGPNQGADDPNAFIRNVAGDPFAGFAGSAGTDLVGFDFNDAGLYSGGGIARVTLSAVPEPSSWALLSLGAVLVGSRRFRCRGRVA